MIDTQRLRLRLHRLADLDARPEEMRESIGERLELTEPSARATGTAGVR